MRPVTGFEPATTRLRGDNRQDFDPLSPPLMTRRKPAKPGTGTDVVTNTGVSMPRDNRCSSTRASAGLGALNPTVHADTDVRISDNRRPIEPNRTQEGAVPLYLLPLWVSFTIFTVMLWTSVGELGA